MNEVMSLEEYKKKVLQCLMENHNDTETEAKNDLERNQRMYEPRRNVESAKQETCQARGLRLSQRGILP